MKYGSTVTDEMLCARLDACAELTPNERAIVVSAMAKYVELGRLPQKHRDWCMAIARARGLFAATETKAAPKKAKPLGVDGGDPFSTRWTAGTDFAAKILERRPLRPPIRRAG